MTVDEIERALTPYLRDGGEAVEAIVQLIQSPHRPPDLRRAIEKILRQRYGNCVHIDAVQALFATEENVA
jgi:hypothetical protein